MKYNQAAVVQWLGQHCYNTLVRESAEYHQEYDRRRYLEKKALLINLLGGKCSQCESQDQLEFDHVNPQIKTFSILTSWKLPLEDLRDELEKCQLLCHDCHDKKTYGSSTHRLQPHGTYTAYKRGCRCEECRIANRDYNRIYKENKPRLPPEHGSANMYQYHKCRCDTCKEGQRLRAQVYRASKPKGSG